MTDINGDGHPDVITGKRHRARNDGDPGAFDPAVLYWFEFIPAKNNLIIFCFIIPYFLLIVPNLFLKDSFHSA
jgi:hypothetical protein